MPTSETPLPALLPTRLLFLPEIVEVLAHSLAQPDLFRCIKVCRAWYNLFHPYMYIYINDHLHNWPKILGRLYLPKTTPDDHKDEDWLLDLFTKHGHHIRQLQAHWCVTINALAAAQTCTQLVVLSVAGQSWNKTRSEMVESGIWRPPGLSTPSDEASLKTYEQHLRIRGRWLSLLIRQNSKTLQKLRIDQVGEIEKLDPEVLEGLLRSCERLDRLEISDLEWRDTKQINIPRLVEDVPQIQHFVYRSRRWNRSLLQASMPNLKTLTLETEVPIRAVFQLLKNMPHLQALWMKWSQVDYLYHDALGAILDHAPHRLERLSISWIGFRNDEYLAKNVLPWLPDLVDLATEHIGPALAQLIPTRYRNLRSYNQSNPVTTICPKCPLLHSKVNTLSVLLENCPHLTEFDGIEHRIEADYLLDHPWVCKGLKVLRFQIVGVHRLSEEEDMDYRQGRLFLRINKELVEKEKQAIEKHERLQVQQQRIYDRLAELGTMDQLPTEILTDIGSYFSLKDYLHCIQVSRYWYSVFVPFLWQNIDDSLYAWPRILKTLDSHDTAKPSGQDEKWLLGIFAKYGRHIQHLHLHWKVTIKAASIGNSCSNDDDKNKDIRVACTNLKSLSVADIDDNLTQLQEKARSAQNKITALPPSTTLKALTGPLISPLFENAFKPQLRGIRTEDQQLEDWRLVQQFWLLVQQNHAHLQTLRIDASLDSLVEMNTTGFVDSVVVDHLTNLVDLQYTELRCDTATLLCRLPRLRSLQSQVVITNGVLTGWYASIRCLRAYRSLSLLEIITLLQRLPNLNELALTQIKYEGDEEPVIASIDMTAPSALQSLRISWSSKWDALSLQGLSAWLPHLVDLSIGRMRYDIAMTLGVYYPQLESLTDPLETTKSRGGAIAIHSRVLAVVLSSCINLITLDAQVHMLDMSFHVNEPWECLGLETLRCQVRGITRLTQTEEWIYNDGCDASAVKKAVSYLLMDGHDYEAEEIDPESIMRKQAESVAQQKRAYDRLAGLKNLKSLQLGSRRHRGMSYYPDYLRQDDTLELTMASGLGRLSELKELEVFAFEGTSHRVGKAELEWMADNWPRLRELRGLNDRESEEKLKEYMYQLRPDVVLSDF
ncbi:hypothetical protein BG015_007631 [Linnemannia schmuckeri]|uniref:F-box domain-containing protein n=1 Tax=Linnemannia schmuckeri TaxID=64567 RepID=A0A9P5VAR7_9FUNG|nr:hypothetical protein BG015_007631 [Linnemannia schmuckeri]